MTLTEHAASYVAARRATGLSFADQARLLASYAIHAEAQGDVFIQSATVLDWASQALSPHQRIVRLRVVRGFAKYLHAEDERHDVPHPDAMGRRTRHRPAPHLLSTDQIRQIMAAALELPAASSTTPRAIHTLIGVGFLIDPLRISRIVSCGFACFFPRSSDIAGHRHRVQVRSAGMPGLPAA